jgi:hypothetical protein
MRFEVCLSFKTSICRGEAEMLYACQGILKFLLICKLLVALQMLQLSQRLGGNTGYSR